MIMKLKPTHRAVLIVLGVPLFFAGLWGGAWLCEIFPLGSAYAFAAFVTGFVAAGLGVASVMCTVLWD